MTDALKALFDNSVVTLALIFFAAWLIGQIVEEIGKYACHRQEVDLKRELVDRGLSASDIERIIAASGPALRESDAESTADNESQVRLQVCTSPKESAHVNA